MGITNGHGHGWVCWVLRVGWSGTQPAPEELPGHSWGVAVVQAAQAHAAHQEAPDTRQPREGVGASQVRKNRSAQGRGAACEQERWRSVQDQGEQVAWGSGVGLSGEMAWAGSTQVLECHCEEPRYYPQGIGELLRVFEQGKSSEGVS